MANVKVKTETAAMIELKLNGQPLMLRTDASVALQVQKGTDQVLEWVVVGSSNTKYEITVSTYADSDEIKVVQGRNPTKSRIPGSLERDAGDMTFQLQSKTSA